MKVGVALLYGLYSSERLDYKEYLDFLVQDIEARKLDKLILCGGYTNPKKPDLSEAQSVKDYLATITQFNNYELEESSINTNQNLELAAKKVTPNDEIYIYCDLIRKAKVIWMSLHFFLRKSKNEVYKILYEFASHKDIYKEFNYDNLSVAGFDFSGKSKEETIGQTYATLFDVIAIYDKELDEIDIQYRKKLFGLK